MGPLLSVRRNKQLLRNFEGQNLKKIKQNEVSGKSQADLRKKVYP